MAKKLNPTSGPLTTPEGKLQALQAAMSKIEKDFGKGSIMKLGDEKVANVEVISTGSIGLNAALGDASSKSSAPNHRVRPHWPYTPSPRHRKPAA